MADLHHTLTNDVEKFDKNTLKVGRIPHSTPHPRKTQEEHSQSAPLMSEYSLDNDPTLNYESAENSPLNTSVIDTFNSAYGYAIINSDNSEISAETHPENTENVVPENHPPTTKNTTSILTQQNTGRVDNNVSTGVIKKQSVVLPPPANSDMFPKFESAYKTPGMPSTVMAKVLNFGTEVHPATSSEDERNKNNTKEENKPPLTIPTTITWRLMTSSTQRR